MSSVHRYGLVLLALVAISPNVVISPNKGKAQAQPREPHPPTRSISSDLPVWNPQRRNQAQPSSKKHSLPSLPPSYTEERTDHATWVFPRSARAEVRSLQEELPAMWEEITGELTRKPVPRELHIRVAVNPKDMRLLAPTGLAPPGYAVGVAYPHLGVVMLTLTAPETWKRPELSTVLRHELSHVALFRVVEGHPLPRWFVEGVAVMQAEEYGMERVQALWHAQLQDRVIPLEDLATRFPTRSHEVNLAYAQSADLVAHMLRDRNGRARFRAMLSRVSKGERFDAAMLNSYFLSPRALEESWHDDLAQRFDTIPLLIAGSTVWAVASLLLLLAWRRRRRDHHKRLQELEEREAEFDVPPPEHVRDRQTPNSDAMLVVVRQPRSGDRDVSIPTVEINGESHTLH